MTPKNAFLLMSLNGPPIKILELKKLQVFD